MTKYQEYVEKMLTENETLFDSFRALHDRYSLDQENIQEEFNKLGEKVMQIVRHYEDRLCNRSESSGYGTFTGGLAEKFQTEVKKHFPLIDNVGIIITTTPPTPEFTIKKINLS